ncbi:hypothetical protein CSOJ01_09263 [Colletotrichum sojae]|uniref:Uncharacterized protein n=1 Tax=Colletotrichum sojae TaxID=2175907 RepID=A0A8H6J3A9_9PEZI|nr:hypothetical protein CSOJ01_09263 [Colletotrichum sojae]
MLSPAVQLPDEPHFGTARRHATPNLLWCTHLVDLLRDWSGGRESKGEARQNKTALHLETPLPREVSREHPCETGAKNALALEGSTQLSFELVSPGSKTVPPDLLVAISFPSLRSAGSQTNFRLAWYHAICRPGRRHESRNGLDYSEIVS